MFEKFTRRPCTISRKLQMNLRQRDSISDFIPARCPTGIKSDRNGVESIKRQVAKKNVKFNLFEVENLTRQQVSLLTLLMFAKYVQHAIREEEKYKEATRIEDQIQDGALDVENSEIIG